MKHRSPGFAGQLNLCGGSNAARIMLEDRFLFRYTINGPGIDRAMHATTEAGRTATSDRPSALPAQERARDRSSWPTRLCKLSDEGDDDDVLALTPAQRIEMMWTLAVNAWAFMGEDVCESPFQRHVVEIERRGG
jgi:hypothetical protein